MYLSSRAGLPKTWRSRFPYPLTSAPFPFFLGDYGISMFWFETLRSCSTTDVLASQLLNSIEYPFLF